MLKRIQSTMVNRNVAGAASHREEYLYNNVACHVLSLNAPACKASESMISGELRKFWGGWSGFEVVVEKTTEPLGTNGDGIHVFALRQTFDSVRPFFCPCPMDG